MSLFTKKKRSKIDMLHHIAVSPQIPLKSLPYDIAQTPQHVTGY